MDSDLATHRRRITNDLVGRWLGAAPIQGPWPSEAQHAAVRARHVAPVRLAFGGDVHGEGRVATLLRAGGNPLDEVAHLLAAADVSVVNLETAVGTTGSPQPGKAFTFRAPPALPGVLRSASVDVVSLANNHALDYGVTGLLETIGRAEAAGLEAVGAGRNAEEAYAPALMRVGRRTVAVVGLSRVLPAGWAAGANRPGIASAYDTAAAVRAVERAAAQADVTVVAIHWGRELHECPDAHQLDLARRLSAAGADVIAGHHPHILQGVQRRGDTEIAYSLGNFVWYHSREPSRRTGVWEVTAVTGRAVSQRLEPAVIDGRGAPVPVSGRLAGEILSAVAARSPGGGRCGF